MYVHMCIYIYIYILYAYVYIYIYIYISSERERDRERERERERSIFRSLMLRDPFTFWSSPRNRTSCSISLCISIYIYVYVYVYAYIYIYVCMCVCIYIYIYTHVYTSTHTCNTNGDRTISFWTHTSELRTSCLGNLSGSPAKTQEVMSVWNHLKKDLCESLSLSLPLETPPLICFGFCAAANASSRRLPSYPAMGCRIWPPFFAATSFFIFGIFLLTLYTFVCLALPQLVRGKAREWKAESRYVTERRTHARTRARTHTHIKDLDPDHPPEHQHSKTTN